MGLDLRLDDCPKLKLDGLDLGLAQGHVLDLRVDSESQLVGPNLGPVGLDFSFVDLDLKLDDRDSQPVGLDLKLVGLDLELGQGLVLELGVDLNSNTV